MNYREYNDSEILSYIEEENEDAYNLIYEKYMPLIKKTANRMNNIVKGLGIDQNDLIQEGMIGLSRALKYYDKHQDVTFYTFAKKCIESSIVSCIIREKKNKNKILNESISLDNIVNETENITYEDIFGDDRYNPEKNFISDNNTQELIELAHSKLTQFEIQVFDLRINGFDNNEIANILNKDYKSVDNAIQRIKHKLRRTRI